MHAISRERAPAEPQVARSVTFIEKILPPPPPPPRQVFFIYSEMVAIQTSR